MSEKESGNARTTRDAIERNAAREHDGLRRQGLPAPSKEQLASKYREAVVNQEKRKER